MVFDFLLPVAHAAATPIPVDAFAGQTTASTLCDLLRVSETDPGLIHRFFKNTVQNFAIAILLFAGVLWAFSAFSSGFISTAKSMFARVIIGLAIFYAGAQVLSILTKLLGVDIFSAGCGAGGLAFDPLADRFTPASSAFFWSNVEDLAVRAINFVVDLIVTAGSLSVLIGGAIYFAGGVEFGDRGKNMVKYAFFGIVIGLFSKIIVTGVSSALGHTMTF